MTPLGVGPDARWCPDCEQRVDKCRCHPTLCKRDVSNVPMYEQQCPDCRHWNGAHPSSRNEVRHCLICELIDAIAYVKRSV